MSKPLTAFSIAAIKPGAVRREIPDGQVQGLRIVVQPSGAMSWALRYRFHGKTAKLTIGPWPAIGLKSARALAQKAHVEIAGGFDPCAVKQEKKAEARLPQAVTVEAALADFIRLYAKAQTRRWRETERILGEFSRSWEGRPMASITRGDVHKVLDGIMARGAPIMANLAFALLRGACAWMVSCGIIDASPCAGLSMPAKAQSRDRVLSDGELAAIWLAADGLEFPYRDVIHILILTGQRRSEVADVLAGNRHGRESMDDPSRAHQEWTAARIAAIGAIDRDPGKLAALSRNRLSLWREAADCVQQDQSSP